MVGERSLLSLFEALGARACRQHRDGTSESEERGRKAHPGTRSNLRSTAHAEKLRPVVIRGLRDTSPARDRGPARPEPETMTDQNTQVRCGRSSRDATGVD